MYLITKTHRRFLRRTGTAKAFTAKAIHAATRRKAVGSTTWGLTFLTYSPPFHSTNTPTGVRCPMCGPLVQSVHGLRTTDHYLRELEKHLVQTHRVAKAPRDWYGLSRTQMVVDASGRAHAA